MKSILVLVSVLFLSFNTNAGLIFNKIYSTCAVLDRMTGDYFVSNCYATTTFLNNDPIKKALNNCEEKLSQNPSLAYLSSFRFLGIQEKSLSGCEVESQKHKERIKQIGYNLSEFNLNL